MPKVYGLVAEEKPFRLTDITEAKGPNRYFRVTLKFPVYTGGGFTRRWREVTASKGDEIHWLMGGIWIVGKYRCNLTKLPN